MSSSLLQRRSLGFFVASRAIRIVPALVLVLVLSAFVLGPLYTELALRDYFSDSRTYTYITRNLGLVDMQWDLPGVFARSAFPHAVNGSLWSLLPEVTMYGYLLLLGAIATLRWKFGSAVVVAGMVLAMVIAWSGRGDLAGTTLEPVTLARLAPYFALGSLAWCLRSWTPHSWALPVAACALAVAALHTSAFVPAFALALAVGVVWLAHIPLGPLARWGRFGDFSYGLYIFAYPVQQALVATFPEWGQVQHGIAAYSITLACAIGSWKLVEAPALRLKRYLPSTRSTSVKMENG